MKLKKRKKTSRIRGSRTFGYGARKKHQGSGHKGGKGMAGTGKRADHKKSLILVKFDKYFGKQGFTSKRAERKKGQVMNIEQILKNKSSIIKKYTKDGVIVLKDYKILGSGEVKEGDFSEMKISAKKFSESAKEKIEKAGGKIILKTEEKHKNKEKLDISGKKEKKK